MFVLHGLARPLTLIVLGLALIMASTSTMADNKRPTSTMAEKKSCKDKCQDKVQACNDACGPDDSDCFIKCASAVKKCLKKCKKQ